MTCGSTAGGCQCVWPDPNRLDKATKKHDGAGDFHVWLAERGATPRKTLFIKGNHEDFVWLEAQDAPEVLPGLFYLKNGLTMDIGEGRDVVVRQNPIEAPKGAEPVAATQDIGTDGLAVDVLAASERGLANGLQVAGYRVGMIVGGGVLLVFYDRLGPTLTFLAMVATCARRASEVWRASTRRPVQRS